MNERIERELVSLPGTGRSVDCRKPPNLLTLTLAEFASRCTTHTHLGYLSNQRNTYWGLNLRQNYSSSTRFRVREAIQTTAGGRVHAYVRGPCLS